MRRSKYPFEGKGDPCSETAGDIAKGSLSREVKEFIAIISVVAGLSLVITSFTVTYQMGRDAGFRDGFDQTTHLGDNVTLTGTFRMGLEGSGDQVGIHLYDVTIAQK